MDSGLPIKAFGVLLTFFGACFEWSANHEKHSPFKYVHYQAFLTLLFSALLCAESLRRSRDLRWLARVALITLSSGFVSALPDAKHAPQMKNWTAGLSLLVMGSWATLLGSLDPATVPARLARGSQECPALSKLLVAASTALTWIGSVLLWANSAKVKSGSDTQGVETTAFLAVFVFWAASVGRSSHARVVSIVLIVTIVITSLSSAIADHQHKALARAGCALVWLGALAELVGLVVIDGSEEEDTGFGDTFGGGGAAGGFGGPGAPGAEHGIPQQGAPQQAAPQQAAPQGGFSPQGGAPAQNGGPNPYLAM